MPEHLHMVLIPPDDLRLGDAIGRFKSWTARQVIDSAMLSGEPPCRGDGRRALWQRRCYDHNCRRVEDVRQKIEYCHKNPVVRGLVDSPSKWVWSSYNWYRGEGRIVLDIDGLEL